MWSFKRPLWNTYCVPGPGDTAVHRAPQISAPSFQTRFSNNFQTREINQTWLCQRRQQGSKGTAGFTDPSELSREQPRSPFHPPLGFPGSLFCSPFTYYNLVSPVASPVPGINTGTYCAQNEGPRVCGGALLSGRSSLWMDQQRRLLLPTLATSLSALVRSSINTC